MQTDSAIIVFVKYPEPGKVKTRLAAKIGNALAADIYSYFVQETFFVMKQVKTAEKFVAFSPQEREKDFFQFFKSEGTWFPQLKSQSLGDRIHHAMNYVLQQGYRRVVAIGTDSPSLPAEYVAQALEELKKHDTVVGPSEDGGYYLIGARKAPKELFQQIDWSTDKVFEQTIARTKEYDLSVQILPAWYDVDDIETLVKLSHQVKFPAELEKRLRPFLVG